MVISKSLGSALDDLNGVISKAAQQLGKMPAAEKAYVDVSAEFINEDGREKEPVSLVYSSGVIGTARGDSFKKLDASPIPTRLRLAKYIPDLLEDAKAKELDVEYEVREVTAAIEQALSNS